MSIEHGYAVSCVSILRIGYAEMITMQFGTELYLSTFLHLSTSFSYALSLSTWQDPQDRHIHTSRQIGRQTDKNAIIEQFLSFRVANVFFELIHEDFNLWHYIL